MKAYVYVSLKKSVLDPQGKTIQGALKKMGYKGLGDVRQGKYFELSLDGGQTFQKVLYKDENTGGVDLAFDPSNANTVYAVLWEERQAPWENGVFTGPGDTSDARTPVPRNSARITSWSARIPNLLAA